MPLWRFRKRVDLALIPISTIQNVPALYNFSVFLVLYPINFFLLKNKNNLTFDCHIDFLIKKKKQCFLKKTDIVYFSVYFRGVMKYYTIKYALILDQELENQIS